MASISRSFTAAGVGNAFTVQPGQSITYDLSGTFSGSAQFEKSTNGGASWERYSAVLTAAGNGSLRNESTSELRVRWRCIARASGTLVTVIADAVDTVQEERHPTTGAVMWRVTDAGIEVPGTLSVSGAVALAGGGTITSPDIDGGTINGAAIGQDDPDVIDGTHGRLRTLHISDPVTGVPQLYYGDVLNGESLGEWISGLDQAYAAAPLREYIAVGKILRFAINDAVLNSTTTITSATANFTADAIGYSVVGTGIPDGTTIASVTNVTTAVLSAAATVTNSPVLLTFSKADQYCNDLEVWCHNGFGGATVGFGGNDLTYRVSVTPPVLEPAIGTLLLKVSSASQTGDVIRAGSQVSGSDAFRLKADGSLQVTTNVATALAIRSTGLTTILGVDANASQLILRGNTSIGLGAVDAPTATIDAITLGANNATFKLRTASWGAFYVTANASSPGTVSMGSSNNVPLTIGAVGGVAMTVSTTNNVLFANDAQFATKTPASATATGIAGTIAWDADYLYVCTATNTWKRAAIATW